MRKANTLVIWRIVFTYIVAWLHFNTIYQGAYISGGGILHRNGWYLGVEFFFIMSGFFLIKTYKEKKTSAWKYVTSRMKKLYPTYLLAYIVSVFFLLSPYGGAESLSEKLEKVMDCFFEIFMLQCTGIGNNMNMTINSIAWYVSALFVLSLIIYNVLEVAEKFYVKLFAPISIIIIYCYYTYVPTSLELYTNPTGIWVYRALLRGLAAMNIGILLYTISTQISREFWSRNKMMLACIEVIGFAAVIYIQAFTDKGLYDFVSVFILAVCILLAYNHTSSFAATKPMMYWSNLTYSIYLNHDVIRRYIMPRLFPTNEYSIVGLLLYFVLITVYSLCMYQLIQWVMKCWERRKNASEKI